VVTDPRNQGTLYASGWSGILKSTDGGASWRGVNSGLPGGNCCGSLAIDPQNPNTIYAGGRYDLAYSDGRFGIFRSKDGGTTWATMGMVWRSVIPQFAIDPDNPSIGLATDPRNPGTVYSATGNLGIFKSTDRAGTWSEMNSGVSATEVRFAAIDPRNPGTIYASTSEGLLKTTDWGGNWSPANSGLPNRPVLLAIDPQDTSTIYAAIVPNVCVDNTCLNSAIFKSVDGGASWSAAGPAPEGYFYGPLAIDPQNPTTLYAAGVPPGSFGELFQSTDGGTDWTKTAYPYHGNGISALAIDPQDPNALYVAAEFRVFKSTDRGASWSDLGVPVDSLGDCDECVAVSLLAVDPRNSDTIYACGSVGVLKSIDGGATWNAMNLGLPWSPAQYDAISALPIDPRDSNKVYVAIAGRVFISTDGTATWNELDAGLMARSVTSLALDPVDPDTLYAGTNGGGLFKITFVSQEGRQ
jgi:photosystem II stability/assembly factor-like uncharacterized protein